MSLDVSQPVLFFENLDRIALQSLVVLGSFLEALRILIQF